MRTPSSSSTGSKPQALGEREGLRHVVDRPGGNARRVQPLGPGIRRVGRERGLQLGGELLAVGDPPGVRREPCIADELRPAEDAAEALEDRVVAARQRQVAVRGAERLVRRDRRVPVARARGHRVRVQERGAEVQQRGEGAVHQRHLDVLARAGRGARLQRGERPDRRVEPGEHVGQRGARLARRPVRVAGDRHVPAHRLDEQVVAGELARRLAGAEGADRRVDDARVALADRGVAQPEPVHRAGPEGLEHDVRARAELGGERLVAGVAQVERQRALAAVEAQVVRRALVDERGTPLARVVTRPGALDLDDVGSEVAERLRAERSGEHAGEVGDEQAVEGTVGHGAAGYAAPPHAHPRHQ